MSSELWILLGWYMYTDVSEQPAAYVIIDVPWCRRWLVSLKSPYSYELRLSQRLWRSCISILWVLLCRSCLYTKLHVFIFRKTEMFVCRHLVCNTTFYVRVIFSFLHCLHLHEQNCRFQKSERIRYVIGLVIAVSKPGWLNLLLMNTYTPIPVAARSKQWVCGCSLAGIAGSNSAGGMGICLLWVLCVVRGLCDGPIPRQGES